MHLLPPEVHLTGLGVHAVHDSERLELIAQIADNTAALLETLLHGNADALDRTAGLCTIEIRPCSAQPFARKSSITSTWSSGPRNFLETIT